MGRITTSVGLISGFPIQSTVNSLIQIDSAPITALQTATTTLTNQQDAITATAALVLALEGATDKLGDKTLYTQSTATSANPSALGATVTGTPSLGNYQFTPVTTAQAQQSLSGKFASQTSPIGAGSLSLQFGGFINPGASVDLLNDGNGLSRGKILITDRSGATATIDLSGVSTVDDVTSAINSASGINVVASTDGNHLVLTDKTGQSVSNLKVAEVGGGSTAASLGLASINTNTNQASGSDVLGLFNDLSLSFLNNGNGVRFDAAQPDLALNFADGTSTTIDFNKLGVTGTTATATTPGLNGTNAQLTFTANTAGAASTGVQILFENDPTVHAGSETANYDATNKVLTFHIQAGQTTAAQIITALQNDPTASAAFTATLSAGSNGSGTINVGDNTITHGPLSTATTQGTLSAQAAITFTATQGGSNYDGVTVKFVDNPSITAGQETVAYDDSDPNNKQLVFQIDAGHTTANQVIAALNNDPSAAALFTAARATGTNGQGLISTSDTATTSGGAIVEPVAAGNVVTLGQLLSTINAAAPGKISATIAPDGQHIQLTDLTSGSNTFSASELNGSHVLDDLGLDGPSQSGVISSGHLLAGLQSSLLANLNGGQGITGLGELTLTDRAGVSNTIDLSGAQTLDDVIDTINSAGVGIKASVNAARNGLLLTDTTGATLHNLTVADGDGTTQTADRLGIAVDSAATTKDSGSLNVQTVGENTTLASLNGGQGVTQGNFNITDTNNVTRTLTVSAGITTVGQLLDQINNLGLAVHAQINPAGNGIVLQDTAHGSGTLNVTEGNRTTAANLHLLGGSSTQTVGGQPTQVINGSNDFTVAIGANDTLQDVVNNINKLGLPVSASIVNDGSTVVPYRLAIASTVTGKAGALEIDSSQSTLNIQQNVAAQNAVLAYGSTSGAAPIYATSATNTFANLVPGLSLQVSATSATPIGVNVTAATNNLTSTVQAVVASYNSLIQSLATNTTYDTTTNTKALLQGDGTVLTTQSQISSLFSGQLTGFSDVTSLTALGITINSDGTLTFDPTVLQAKFASDPQGVQAFFAKSGSGFSAQVHTLAEQLAGSDNSLLGNRSQGLNTTITDNNARIAFLNARLAVEKQRLLDSFNNMELAIAKIQSNQSALSSIANLIASNNGNATAASTGSSSNSSNLSNVGASSSSGGSSSG